MGLWASGEEFNSYRMVANAWPKWPFMFIAIEVHYVCLFSRFCFETKSPCLAQAGLELTVSTKLASSSGHHLTRVGTEVDTSMNSFLVLGDRCPLYTSMGTGLKGAPCTTDKDLRSTRHSRPLSNHTPLCIQQLQANNGPWVQGPGSKRMGPWLDRLQGTGNIRSGSSGRKYQALNEPLDRSSGPASAIQETFQNKK